MLRLWKKQNRPTATRPWLQASLTWVAGAALVVGLGSWNLWAFDDKGGPEGDTFLSSGDSIGTLPMLANGPGQLPGQIQWGSQGWDRPASLTLLVSPNQLRSIVQASSGTGWLEWSTVDHSDRVELRLHGAGQLRLDPELVRQGDLQLSLQSQSPEPWFYAAQVDGWVSAPAQANGNRLALDLERTLPERWGSAPLVLHTRTWSGESSRIEFSRKGGYLNISQSTR